MSCRVRPWKAGKYQGYFLSVKLWMSQATWAGITFNGLGHRVPPRGLLYDLATLTSQERATCGSAKGGRTTERIMCISRALDTFRKVRTWEGIMSIKVREFRYAHSSTSLIGPRSVLAPA